MNYDRPELLDRLAAEYVFGSLSPLARRRFDALRRTLPAADAAARAWEARTAPLASVVPSAAPSPELWAAIERRTGGARSPQPARSGWLDFLKPALGFALGVVAALGIVRLYPDTVVPVDEIVQARGTLPESYVGLLTSRDGAPVILASSTRHGRSLFVKILRNVDVPPGKVLQLWALPNGSASYRQPARPRSRWPTPPKSFSPTSPASPSRSRMQPPGRAQHRASSC